MPQGTKPSPSGAEPDQNPTGAGQKAPAETGHTLSRACHFQPQDLPEKPAFSWWWRDARQLTVCAAFVRVRTFFFHLLPSPTAVPAEGTFNP